MKQIIRLPERNIPLAVIGAVALLLLAGIAVIVQNEAAYRELQRQETNVQAEILSASVTAALDFNDNAAAQEAVDAIRVNRQIRTVGVYNSDGALVAGYGRNDAPPPRTEGATHHGPGSALISTAVVLSRGEQIGSVYLAADPEPLSRRLSRYVVICLMVLLASLVVGVLGLAQNALRRANRQLAERADALAEANAELKVQVGERTKAEDQLRQAHKMQALGQLTGGIAHDFNNLLTVIQGSADMLKRPELKEDKRLKFADAIVQASSRAAALTGQLLAFARRQPLRPEVIEVNALVRGMTVLLDRTLGERIRIRTDLANGACTIEADRAQLESALLNVAVNARDAMLDGGILTISTSPETHVELGPCLAISVADTGSGMDEETLARAFEPFFTTKATGKGTGLGLSQVYGFATQSGGDVRIESVDGHGTKVTLILPCRGDVAALAEAKQGAIELPKRTGRILLVEDNAEVGEFAENLLVELGHHVTRVRTGEEALERVESQTFDLVFSDVVMPGISGLDLAERLSQSRPGLPIVLTTGYSDEIAKSGTGGRPVVLKPYGLETLAAAIDQALPQ